jgi:MFS family permease
MAMVSEANVKEPGYRWVILAASSVILAAVMGQIVNGLSVYFVPLETAYGWDRGDIALINTAGLVGLALGSIVLGQFATRIGARRLALLGISAAGLSMLAASRADQLWQLYALFFIAGALGGGALSAPLMALVGNWFVRNAGFAIGVTAAGQALGQGGVPFTGTFLIEALGWRGALATQGAVMLIALLPFVLLLRDPPRPAPGAAALSDETPSGLSNEVITAWLSAAVVFCCTCMSVPLIHLVPLIQGCGIPAPAAGGVFFVMLLVAIAGRVVFGRLADVLGAIPAYLIASGWQTALVFGFTFLGRLDSFFLYAAIYGFGYGGVMTTLLVTARNLTAPARRAASMGVILALAYLGHGLGGWQGGFFYDLTGAYTWPYANAAFAGLANLIIVGSLWMTLRRRRSPTLDLGSAIGA